MPLLSIITITKDDYCGLSTTLTSLKQLDQKYLFEYLIIDSDSEKKNRDLYKEFSSVIDLVICGEDNGIYNAMNIGLSNVKTKLVMFLNSGDVIAGSLEGIERPSFLPVFHKTKNQWVKEKQIDESVGIPHCHQGIVFPATNFFFDERYRICSDYDYFLRHYFNSVAFYPNKGCQIIYEGGGVSEKNRYSQAYENLLINLKYFRLSILIKKYFNATLNL